MPTVRPVPCLLLLLLVSAPLLAGTDGAVADTWSSPLQDLTYVHIEKRGRADVQPACPGCPLKGSEALEGLPPDLLQKAGANAMDYEGFLDTYLPEAAAQDLAEVARHHGLLVAVGVEREIELPWHTFTPGKSTGRDDAEVTSVVPPRAVPNMFLAQFAAPEQDHVAYLRVQSNLTDLASVATWDADLLSIAGQSEAATSDERQGQIVSGNHFATSVCTNLATCPYPRYKTWLNSRGLLGAANQQTVAIVDRGYDDGGGPTPGVIDHHPDLESPERLAGLTGVNPASLVGR